MILITGATGNVGRPLLQALAGRDDVRALLLPDEDDRAAVATGAEVVRGDLSDPASLEAPFAGVDRLFLLSPFVEGHEALELAAIDAAEQAGVRRIVKLAYAGIDWPIAITDGHRVVEERLAEAAIDEVVLLHAEVYASNLLTQAEYLKGGQLVLPAPAAQIAYVDPADVGAVAAVLLTQADVPDGPVVVTGPELLTNGDVARIAGEVLGRDVAATHVPAGPWSDALVEAGVPAYIARAVGEMHETVEAQGPLTPTATVEQLLGREPTPVRDVLSRALAA